MVESHPSKPVDSAAHWSSSNSPNGSHERARNRSFVSKAINVHIYVRDCYKLTSSHDATRPLAHPLEQQRQRANIRAQTQLDSCPHQFWARVSLPACKLRLDLVAISISCLYDWTKIITIITLRTNSARSHTFELPTEFCHFAASVRLRHNRMSNLPH